MFADFHGLPILIMTDFKNTEFGRNAYSQVSCELTSLQSGHTNSYEAQVIMWKMQWCFIWKNKNKTWNKNDYQLCKNLVCA